MIGVDGVVLVCEDRVGMVCPKCGKPQSLTKGQLLNSVFCRFCGWGVLKHV